MMEKRNGIHQIAGIGIAINYKFIAVLYAYIKSRKYSEIH